MRRRAVLVSLPLALTLVGGCTVFDETTPPDEALATAVIDIGGRPYAVIDLPFRGELVRRLGELSATGLQILVLVRSGRTAAALAEEANRHGAEPHPGTRTGTGRHRYTCRSFCYYRSGKSIDEYVLAIVRGRLDRR